MRDDAFAQYVAQLRAVETVREHTQRMQQDYGVFISYTQADKKVADRLARFFKRNGIRYFLDRKHLRWGDSLNTKLAEHMDVLTHYVLILSNRSAKARWCREEWGLACGQKKERLALLTSNRVKVPPFAQSVIATADMEDVKRYFASGLIDSRAVERLAKMILADRKADLAAFVPLAHEEAGYRSWTSAEATMVLAERPSIAKQFLDDYSEDRDWRLLRIDVSAPRRPPSLTLHYSRLGAQRVFDITYCAELSAILAECRPPQAMKKEGADPMGSVERTPSGEQRISRGLGSVEDQLKGTRQWLYGWSATSAFWQRTYDFVSRTLPKKKRIPPTRR
jgi:hypothetical protein